MLNVQTISRLKKDRFLLSLSEDEFRDRVVRPLLLRIGFQDGRDLCGPTEAGKDAIFVKIDLLGTKQLFAVQTKKGNLNLASKASHNLVNAITQLRTALTTDIVLTASKERLRPLQVYLCASGKINDSARDHISREVPSPSIVFLDSEDLVPRLGRL